MMTKRQSTIRLSEEGWDKLKQLAKRQRISQTSMLELIIDDYYDRKVPKADRQQQKGDE